MEAETEDASHADQPNQPDQLDQPDHEAILTGVVALASLFSNCVEAFGLIHPAHKERREQLLLARLGIQQARLLIWGDAVGVSSPPKTVTDRAVPKYPSASYPDLTEPTFFGVRDPRLDEPDTRRQIEDALNAIADRSSHVTREQMMERYGLRPPKRVMPGHEPALDTNRLEAFREKYELLQEVAETYARIDARRTKSIVTHSWVITDPTKFSGYIRLIQDSVDQLIKLMDVKDRVDRAMRVDIRSFGWHLIDDRARANKDKIKLGLIQEACEDDYPEYQTATQQALDQISREQRERTMPNHPTLNGKAAPTAPAQDKQKRPSLLGFFKSFNKSKDSVQERSKSLAAPSGNLAPVEDPVRAKSDAGQMAGDEDAEPMEAIRSKSLGHILEPTGIPLDEDFARTRLSQVDTANTDESDHEPLKHTNTFDSHISRHDQYQGIARTATRDLRQT